MITTYTGKKSEMDEQQPWFKALPEDLQQAVRLLEGQNGLAHTQAEVSVQLFGAKGSGKRAGPMRLAHAGGAGSRIFLPHSRDEFVITCEDIGEIDGIELSVNPEGMHEWTEAPNPDGTGMIQIPGCKHGNASAPPPPPLDWINERVGQGCVLCGRSTT